MNKNQRTDFSTYASADGELSEEDIFSIDISPSSSPPAHQIQRTKSGLKNVEASGLLAALPGQSSGNSHVLHHKAPSSTASSSSSSSSSRTIPTAPKPPRERVPYPYSFKEKGKHARSAPIQVPTLSSAMMNHYKNNVKLTEEEVKKLPSHGIADRSLAQQPSFLSKSMLEGKRIKLKGRDLLRVRNAIFRRTGFID